MLQKTPDEPQGVCPASPVQYAAPETGHDGSAGAAL